MEVFNAYLVDSQNLLNGVTAFSVLQSLTFIYWSQTDDFKDSVRYGGHLLAPILIVVFMMFYIFALYDVTKAQLDLIGHLTDPIVETRLLRAPLTVEDLQHYAWASMWKRVVVVALFHALSIFGLTRYFLKRYTLPVDRKAVV